MGNITYDPTGITQAAEEVEELCIGRNAVGIASSATVYGRLMCTDTHVSLVRLLPFTTL